MVLIPLSIVRVNGGMWENSCYGPHKRAKIFKLGQILDSIKTLLGGPNRSILVVMGCKISQNSQSYGGKCKKWKPNLFSGPMGRILNLKTDLVSWEGLLKSLGNRKFLKGLLFFLFNFEFLNIISQGPQSWGFGKFGIFFTGICGGGPNADN